MPKQMILLFLVLAIPPALATLLPPAVPGGDVARIQGTAASIAVGCADRKFTLKTWTTNVVVYGYDAPVGTVQGIFMGVATVADCQKICQYYCACTVFTYTDPKQIYSGHCTLYSGKAYRIIPGLGFSKPIVGTS